MPLVRSLPHQVERKIKREKGAVPTGLRVLYLLGFGTKIIGFTANVIRQFEPN